MPRKPCDQTIEHRISLGEVERRELKKISAELDGLIESKKVANFAGAITWPVIEIAGAAGIGIAGYYIGQGLADFFPSLEWGEVREDGTRITLKELLTSKDEYTFNNPDGSTRTYKNPFSGWPIFEPLFGVDINLDEYIRDTGFTGRDEDLWRPQQNTQAFTPANVSPAVAQCAKEFAEHGDEDRWLRCLLNAQIANLGR